MAAKPCRSARGTYALVGPASRAGQEQVPLGSRHLPQCVPLGSRHLRLLLLVLTDLDALR
ncbi:MAG TPA: hypothetical protein VN688_29900 [Gemmataceae bacterium]|nr:hypothetical protein [Gemmataceae bacterium]